MIFSLSTRWNARRHKTGEAMIEEILRLGIDHVELGFDLTVNLVPGVTKMIAAGAVKADSLHNFCPLPIGAPAPHPELFALTSTDARVRESALIHTRRTIEFAAEVGARTVVFHAGPVEMKNQSERLFSLYGKGEAFTPAYEDAKLKLMLARDKYVQRQRDFLYAGIEALLPDLERAHVRLGIEIVPFWEGMPSEIEMEGLAKHFQSPYIGYWHDIGHGEIRQRLGFISHIRWLERLLPYLAGVHVHDVADTLQDHLMPPRGSIDFGRLKFLANRSPLLVLEPDPRESEADVRAGIGFMQNAWKTE